MNLKQMWNANKDEFNYMIRSIHAGLLRYRQFFLWNVIKELYSIFTFNFRHTNLILVNRKYVTLSSIVGDDRENSILSAWYSQMSLVKWKVNIGCMIRCGKVTTWWNSIIWASWTSSKYFVIDNIYQDLKFYWNNWNTQF